MTRPDESLRSALAERYTIERELGRGGNAVVYLAHDQKHNRKVALKVLLPELALAVRAERFLREIQIAAKLSYPIILTLIRRWLEWNRHGLCRVRANRGRPRCLGTSVCGWEPSDESEDEPVLELPTL